MVGRWLIQTFDTKYGPMLYSHNMKLWLDDVRPAPDGWKHARTVEEAKAFLLFETVEEASLDHDLGLGPICDTCEEFICEVDGRLDAHLEGGECVCSCHQPLPTGYDLVKWMAENSVWPRAKPRVHSANPVGRANMEAIIERYWEMEE